MGYWTDKHVFVTGCTGMVGSWLAKQLADEGALVVGLIRDSVPMSNLHWSGTIDRIVTVRGELVDYELLLRILHEYQIDSCFHLAAQTQVTIANQSPLSTFEANIKGSWNLLEAARNTKSIKRIAFASSDKAYGTQAELPYYETAPLIGRFPYDVSKSCADLIAQSYFQTFEMPVGIARCGNIFGGGDLNLNRIVPHTMRSVYDGVPPVIRSDGTPTRDYVHVLDAVHAYLSMARALDDVSNHGESFNFSYEEPHSVKEFVDLSLHALGRDDLAPKIIGESIPAGEIPHQYLASEKARRVLQWKPLLTTAEGIRLTYDWYRDYFDWLNSKKAQ